MGNKNCSLGDLVKELEDYYNRHARNLKLINSKDLDNYRLYLKSVEEYLKLTKEGYQGAKDCLIELLSTLYPGFKFDSLSNYKLNYFDISVLLLLAIVILELGDADLSTSIMMLCMDRLELFSKGSLVRKKMLLKIMYNLSYNYHIEDNHQDALSMADKAIEYAVSKDMLYLLPHLYYRKGIAEYNLGISGFMDSLRKSVTLLDIYNLADLKHQFIIITRERYNIEIQ